MSEYVLEIRGLNKSFGPTLANVNVDFTLRRGEVRGLIGENGSGKSTLLSQIAGLYPRDSGDMLVNGEPYNPRSPLDANSHKISMVMQELGVVGNLPASVNVFLGHTDEFSKFGIVSLRKMKKAAQEQFEKWDIPMPPLSRLTDGMMIESRKMIELARALSVDPDILLLDEVTQSLSLNNRNRLYELIKKLKSMGRSVIVITHDIEEMIEITDTITVLRDGEVVGSVNSAETNPDEIRMMMVGRQVSGSYYRADMKPDYSDEVVLRVDDMEVPGELSEVSFEVHAGEILGFCGLSDSGIHTVGKAAFGLAKLSKGTVHMVPTDTDITSAPQAQRNYMGYVPKDRDNEALMIHANIRDNVVMPSMRELTGGIGFLNPPKLARLANDTRTSLSVKSTGILQPMDALSGGNKQKVNLGRWLAKDLKLLILDCPTRGVDVGVKAYIYSLMKEAKTKGIAMILISDELTEVLGMADRLFVMKNGRIKKEIRRDEDFTEQSVIGVMI
ncbi:MAG: sugar ABC transporter ATP-binding protein [Oscillospiraceae bacterium]|nr:sugar ABC transporter ATP-binding protein [Oscillospiraceae bacterium]